MSSCMSFPSPAPAALAAGRRVLKGLEILERDRPGFEEIGDEQARRSAEQLQEVSNQSAAVLPPVDRGLEQLRVADLLDLFQSAFLFEAIDERLNGRVSDALFLGQTLEDFADGAGSQLPALFENSRFGPGKAGDVFHRSPTSTGKPTTCCVGRSNPGRARCFGAGRFSRSVAGRPSPCF